MTSSSAASRLDATTSPIIASVPRVGSIMGTRESETLGYPADQLDLWARRARAWATGARPEGLDHMQPMPKPNPPRDVFLYVISGYKPRNPAAAIALMERIGA